MQHNILTVSRDSDVEIFEVTITMPTPLLLRAVAILTKKNLANEQAIQ